MERSIGQFAVLGDTDLERAYAERREAFLLASGNLALFDLGPSARNELRDLVAEEARLHERIVREPGRFGDIAELAGAFARLDDRARAVAAESRTLVQSEVSRTRNAAAKLQRLLIVLASTAIPAAIGLALISIMLINRPLAAIKLAIAGLGSGDFRSPVKVSGPQDLQELGDQVDWLRRRIVALENEKMNFLRQVSHDLKTPLSSIREGAELLNDATGETANRRETTEIVRIIRESSLRLQALIEDLLQFQRSPSPGQEAQPVVLLKDVIDQVIDKHKLTLLSKDIRVELSTSDIAARGNPVELATVLDNIISNAIKYSPASGAIRVIARGDGGKAIVEVEDDGPGVAADERERVFDPFYRGRARGTARVNSSGLGLAIVKRLIEANGGTVEFLDSVSGARVRASLPVAGHV
jgi:two-component system sensor histidine kinase GlrK